LPTITRYSRYGRKAVVQRHNMELVCHNSAFIIMLQLYRLHAASKHKVQLTKSLQLEIVSTTIENRVEEISIKSTTSKSL
jgi:hypothetical protein